MSDREPKWLNPGAYKGKESSFHINWPSKAPESDSKPMGWVCPVCRSGLAPFVSVCPCGGREGVSTDPPPREEVPNPPYRVVKGPSLVPSYYQGQCCPHLASSHYQGEGCVGVGCDCKNEQDEAFTVKPPPSGVCKQTGTDRQNHYDWTCERTLDENGWCYRHGQR